mmetsp:Transcript_3988/g.10440  ORF Transcript_3988/g.10440 Transcript_3988/m.10440 type:complete len:324 (+) Transcript_3988:93-1064(+)|eukprot:CAMPEP_0197192414 /NCGR_PEP_ID=MMETSP1423-20130617/25030_1 /TAXON_ID=476441 /ORGANISM="Pseudo-nitzschia heimii, Strain UNC1101" /LENGTH=323 /DNA_ID=CAMNT_0042645285 /DNA_START=91 /DNA_END=1062 /DNA_ORIENTATION=+
MMLRLALFLVLGTIDFASAFSSAGNSSAGGPASNGLDDPASEPAVMTRNFIEFTNLNGKESIPASFIERWPNWILETDGTLSRIPDETTGDGIGFVTPTSIDQLYQPIDLTRPNMKLALGIHIRSGQIRHVMPSLDIYYSEGLHRNRGLCSVPLAYNWVDFGFINSMGDNSRYELRIASKKRVDESQENNEEKWNQIYSLPGNVMTPAIERAIVCLAEADSDDLGSGSHIIHVALDEATEFEIPKTRNDLQATLVEVGDDGEEDVDVGILEVAIVATMSGSESEYLPDAYKPLFADESLRNPLYAKFQKRKQKREEETAKREL